MNAYDAGIAGLLPNSTPPAAGAAPRPCKSTYNFDLLSAVMNWVEKGTPPDSVIATGRAFPGRSRPLCAYPKYAHYEGQGDPEDAKNFECRD